MPADAYVDLHGGAFSAMDCVAAQNALLSNLFKTCSNRVKTNITRSLPHSRQWVEGSVFIVHPLRNGYALGDVFFVKKEWKKHI